MGKKEEDSKREREDADSHAVLLPLRSTLTKVVALSVKAARNGKKFDRDGEFRLRVLREAVELTRLWIQGVEGELLRAGVDLERERSRKGEDGGRRGLLGVVPGVASSCLRLLRREEGKWRRVRVLRGMYGSVHASLLDAEEEVGRLEEEASLKKGRRRRRRKRRSADAEGAVHPEHDERLQREEHPGHVEESGQGERRPQEAPVDAATTIAVAAAEARPSSPASAISSVKRLPRSHSLETQVTSSEDKFNDNEWGISVSPASRSLPSGSTGSVARSARSGRQVHTTKKGSSRGHSSEETERGRRSMRRSEGSPHSKQSSRRRQQKITKDQGLAADNQERAELEQEGSITSKKQKSPESDPELVGPKATSGESASGDRGFPAEPASRAESLKTPDVSKTDGTKSSPSAKSSLHSRKSRTSELSSSKHSRISMPESSRSRGSNDEQPMTPKTSLSLHPQRSTSRSKKSDKDTSSRHSSIVSRGRSRTGKLRVIREYEDEARNHADGMRGGQQEEVKASKQSPASTTKHPQQTATAAPLWSFANLDSYEDDDQNKEQGDSRPRQGSRASRQDSNSRHATDLVSEINLSGPQKPKLPRKCHHREHSRSACSSAAWSCELVADEDGIQRIDDHHVHRRAGGCS